MNERLNVLNISLSYVHEDRQQGEEPLIEFKIDLLKSLITVDPNDMFHKYEITSYKTNEQAERFLCKQLKELLEEIK
jgi:hypothetical protein